MRKSDRFFLNALALSLAMLSARGLVFAEGQKAAGVAYKAGTYTATAEGRNGPVVVKVSFSDSAITEIQIVSQNETSFVGDVPLQTYPDLIVQKQSLAVDIVSGATVSSVAVLTAVSRCVEEAGGDPAKLGMPSSLIDEAGADTGK